jgi:hypothetical protein
MNAIYRKYVNCIKFVSIKISLACIPLFLITACNLPTPAARSTPGSGSSSSSEGRAQTDTARPCAKARNASPAEYVLCIGHYETIEAPNMSYRLYVDPKSYGCVNLLVDQAGPGSFIQQNSDGLIRFIANGWVGTPDCKLSGSGILLETIAGSCQQTGDIGYLHLTIREDWQEDAMTFQCGEAPPMPFKAIVRWEHLTPSTKDFYLSRSGSYEVRENVTVYPVSGADVWTLQVGPVPLMPGK